MICFNCKGSGKIESFLLGKEIDCPECKGNGYIGNTNFDRVAASPEALAEFMCQLSFRCFSCGKGNSVINELICPFHRCTGSKGILDWLKRGG